MNLIRIRLEPADAIVRSFVSTSTGLTGVRHSLATPWAQAVAEVGGFDSAAPALLYDASQSLSHGAADLRWRIDFVRARYGDAPAARPVQLRIPNRSLALAKLPNVVLVRDLLAAENPKRILRLLDELLIRGSVDPDAADAILQRLGPSGIDKILARVLPIDGNEFDPTQADAVLAVIRQLVASAVEANPNALHTLLGAGEGTVDGNVDDLLRVTVLLDNSDYPPAVYPAAYHFVSNLLGRRGIAGEYNTRLRGPVDVYGIDDLDPVVSDWVSSFRYPQAVVRDAALSDPARVIDFLTAQGIVDRLANPDVKATFGADATLKTWGDSLAELVAVVTRGVVDLAADESRTVEFGDAFERSYQLLLALRDTVPGSLVGHSGDLRRAAAELLAWHLGALFNGEWPLGGTAGEFARWVAKDDDALQLLTAGVGAFVASELRGLVAGFAAAGPSSASLSGIATLDRIAVAVQFLTMAVLESDSAPDDLAALIVPAVDFALRAALKVHVGDLVDGAEFAEKLLKALLVKLSSEGYDALGELGDVEATDINDLLSQLFFTFDRVDAYDNLADIRPIQAALLAEIVRQYPQVVNEVPAVAEFVRDGQLDPPDPGTAKYRKFIKAFHEVRLSGTEAAASYNHLWAAIREWILRGVDEAERFGN